MLLKLHVAIAIIFLKVTVAHISIIDCIKQTLKSLHAIKSLLIKFHIETMHRLVVMIMYQR